MTWIGKLYVEHTYKLCYYVLHKESIRLGITQKVKELAIFAMRPKESNAFMWFKFILQSATYKLYVANQKRNVMNILKI